MYNKTKGSRKGPRTVRKGASRRTPGSPPNRAGTKPSRHGRDDGQAQRGGPSHLDHTRHAEKPGPWGRQRQGQALRGCPTLYRCRSSHESRKHGPHRKTNCLLRRDWPPSNQPQPATHPSVLEFSACALPERVNQCFPIRRNHWRPADGPPPTVVSCGGGWRGGCPNELSPRSCTGPPQNWPATPGTLVSPRGG